MYEKSDMAISEQKSPYRLLLSCLKPHQHSPKRLIFVLVEEEQGVLSIKWLYCCVSLFDHFIS